MNGKRGRPSTSTPLPKKANTKAFVTIPSDAARYYMFGHFPMYIETRQRCRFCAKGTINFQ